MQIVIQEILCTVFGPKNLSYLNLIGENYSHPAFTFLTHSVRLDNLEVSSGQYTLGSALTREGNHQCNLCCFLDRLNTAN